MKEIVIDNTSLIYLSKLNQVVNSRRKNTNFNSIYLLQDLFNVVHVPLKIREEFDSRYDFPDTPYRQRMIEWIDAGYGVVRLCGQYDTIVKTLLETQRIKGVDPGEIEGIAQLLKTNSGAFLTDDATFLRVVEEDRRRSISRIPYFRHINMFFVLAALDLQGSLMDRDTVIRALLDIYQNERRISKLKYLRAGYLDAASHYRIHFTKNDVDRKVKPFIS